MYKLFRLVYFALPFKAFIYAAVKLFYKPSKKIAGYLKFKGVFRLEIDKGLDLKIYNDNSTLPSLFFWRGLNDYEKISFLIWKEWSKNSRTILDVGANFGIFGLIAKRMNPDSNVILFEPLERNVQRITRNFQLNNLTARIENIAVSDTKGNATFFDLDSSENTIGSLDRSFVELHVHSKIKPIQVSVNTLDSFIQENGISMIDLVKIDVEGFEFEVVKGFLQSIEKFRPTMLIELTRYNHAVNLFDLIKSLSFEYDIYEIHEKLGLSKIGSRIINANGNYLFTTRRTDSFPQNLN